MENQSALVGNHVSSAASLATHPEGTAEHRNASEEEWQTEKRKKEVKRVSGTVALLGAHAPGGDHPENRDRRARNAKKNHADALAREAARDGLPDPDNSLSWAKLSVDACGCLSRQYAVKTHELG